MIRKDQKRWFIAFLMSLGVLINYIDRVNISHALIPISDELRLTPLQQGVVLSAFSWGYVLFMGIGGVLADRYGSARIATISVVMWSLATAWTGIAKSFLSLLFSRIAVGIGESPIFPSNAKLVRELFPVEERGRATAIFDLGSYLGIAISAPLVVFIILTIGWRWSFVACAILGFLWVIVWIKNTRNITKLCPSHNTRQDINIIKLLKNRTILGISIGFFSYNYAKNFFLTWLPTYLVNEKGFDLFSIGYIGLIPPICAVIGELCAGLLTDLMIKGGITATFARKLPICLGMLMAGMVSLAGFTDSNTITLFILSFSFTALIAASPGIWAIPGDIAPNPNLVGTIGGIQNTISNTAGIVAPIITGAILTLTGSFTHALIITSLISIFGAFCYWIVVGPLEPMRIATGVTNA